MTAGWLGMLAGVPLALLWLWVPGGLVLAALRFRGLAIAAVAPAASLGILAVGAVGAGALGVPWTPLTAGAGALVLGGACLGVGALVRRGRPAPAVAAAAGAPATGRAALLPALAGILIVAVQLVVVWSTPGAISQTFDDGFHLNAVRYVLDGGSASSFGLSGVLGSTGFYPAAWHDVVSLVAAGGIDIPTAANAVDFTIAAVVWPLGVVFAAASLRPGRRSAMWTAAIAGGILPWFPLLMLTFGVLYPYFTATALLPVALVLVASIVRRARVPGGLGARIVAAALAAAAIALAQPAVLFALAAFLVPAFVSWAVAGLRRRIGVVSALLALGVVALVAVLAAAWVVVGRFGASAPWGPSAGWRLGAAEAVGLFRDGAVPSALVGVLALAGLVAAWRSAATRWLVGSWVVAAVLFVGAEVLPRGTARAVLLGLFYMDQPRLAALLGVVAVLLTALGGPFLLDAARAFAHRGGRPPKRASVIAAGIVAGVLALALLAVQLGALVQAVRAGRAAFTISAGGAILSSDELALIERLPETTPDDAVIAGNPWTGTNLAYALADREVLNPHFNAPRDADRSLINRSLADAASDPEVCAALERTGAEWVLDFGSQVRDIAGLIAPNAAGDFPGFSGLDRADGFEPVDRQGEAVLYRITACG